MEVETNTQNKCPTDKTQNNSESVLTLSPNGVADIDQCSHPVQRAISEECRALKREILNTFTPGGNPDGYPNNLIMITSISAGEGKTFTSLQLALSLALEPNKYTLLVDTEVVNSTLSKQFTPSPTIGLGDYLVNETISAKDIIFPTSFERLRLLPMGQSDARMNELLNGERMTSLLTEFKFRYPDRLVIFDAPPLLHSNVAMNLAEKMDQIIIVIEAGETSVNDLKRVLARLPTPDKVKFILNKSIDHTLWTK